jgi:hypothetical protein
VTRIDVSLVHNHLNSAGCIAIAEALKVNETVTAI